MRADQFDQSVIALASALRSRAVEFLLLEDELMDGVSIVPGPSRRNLERLVRVLDRLGAEGRVPGERQTLHFDLRKILTRGPNRWLLRVGVTDATFVIVDVADGRYGKYYEVARRVELEPGFSVDVVPDQPILQARRGSVVDVLPELPFTTQRERDRQRIRRRRALRKAEGVHGRPRAPRGPIAATPERW